MGTRDVIASPTIKIGNTSYSPNTTGIGRGNICLENNFLDDWSPPRYKSVITKGYFLLNGTRVGVLLEDVYENNEDGALPGLLHATSFRNYKPDYGQYYDISAVPPFDTLQVSQQLQYYTDLSWGQTSYWSWSFAFTRPSAPGNVRLDSAYTTPGAKTYLRWNASNPGANNIIDAYYVYKNGVYLGSADTGTAFEVTAPSTVGGSDVYTVIAHGGAGGLNSPSSAGVTLYAYGSPTPPTLVTVSNARPAPGSQVTLSWSGASAGAYNAIASYTVYRSTSPDSGYTQLVSGITGTTLTVSAPSDNATKYYYKIMAVGVRSSSALSSAYASLGANAAPSAPTIVGAGVTHNARPRMLITVGADPDADLQSLAAEGWTLSRNYGLEPGSQVLAQKTAAAQPGQIQFVLQQSDPYGASVSAESSVRFEQIDWTDNPIVSGETAVKAAHINELRSALDDLCECYGIDVTDWGEEIVANVTPDINFPAHVAEITAAVQRVARRINNWDSASAVNNVVLPSIPSVSVPTASVINLLRQCISLL